MPAKSMPATLVRPPFEPTWALIKKPQGYQGSTRAPGKIRQIWETNSKSLYRRLSPYADYNSTLFGGFTKEPFYWIYPDEAGKGLSGLKMSAANGRAFPLGDGPIDIIRVSKFLGSGRGIPWLAKQFLLQTGNAFNETRIYNPTSPIIAAGNSLALGAIRPMRHIDLSGGLLGIAKSMIGSAAGLFGTPPINPPPGTVSTALSDTQKGVGGKGLIRAGTAKIAKANLEKAWPQAGALGARSSFLSRALNMVTSMFANFIPQTQDAQARSDEGAYGLMLGIGPKSKFAYNDGRGGSFDFGPPWYAGGKVTRHGVQPHSYKILVSYDQNGKRSNQIVYRWEGYETGITGVGSVGYFGEESTDANNPGVRYGDNVGESISTRRGEEYTNSDIMRQYANYANPKQQFPTKRSDVDLIREKNRQMVVLLDKIRSAGDGAKGDIYAVVVPPDSQIITSDSQRDTPAGYDRLFKAKDRGKKPNKFVDEYRQNGIRVVSNELTSDVKNSLKLPTAGRFDAINTLEVLDKDKKIKDGRLKGWTQWEPYKDDLIALYFYDVVNEKYIPFRASIKGLSENGNASWEELPFIGRGDKIYSYGGFTRALSFNINVVIGSLVELAPTWQRINYLSTLIKPANYTTAKYNGAMNRFMVPPMVMLTIGDLYKDQPILIQTIAVNIPDDASWETQHQISGQQWEYLANYIKAPSDILFGQLPRTVDIALTMVLLEKERAVVGGANFGHAPRGEQWERWNETAVPTGGSPTQFHQSLVVKTVKEGPPTSEPLYDAGTPYQGTLDQTSTIA